MMEFYRKINRSNRIISQHWPSVPPSIAISLSSRIYQNSNQVVASVICMLFSHRILKKHINSASILHQSNYFIIHANRYYKTWQKFNLPSNEIDVIIFPNVLVLEEGICFFTQYYFALTEPIYNPFLGVNIRTLTQQIKAINFYDIEYEN